MGRLMKLAFAFFPCQRLHIIILVDVGASEGHGHIIGFEHNTLGRRGSNFLPGNLWQHMQLASHNGIMDRFAFLGKIVVQVETFHCFRAKPHAVD
jgi:hypothetical protein